MIYLLICDWISKSRCWLATVFLCGWRIATSADVMTIFATKYVETSHLISRYSNQIWIYRYSGHLCIISFQMLQRQRRCMNPPRSCNTKRWMRPLLRRLPRFGRKEMSVSETFERFMDNKTDKYSICDSLDKWLPPSALASVTSDASSQGSHRILFARSISKFRDIPMPCR